MDDRGGVPHRPQREEDSQHQGQPQRQGGASARPAPFRTLHQAEGEQADRTGEEHGSEQVGHTCLVVGSYLVHLAQRDHQQRRTHGQVDQEHPLPAELGQHPADARADRRGDRAGRRPEAHPADPSLRRQRREQDAQAGRGHRRGPCCLQDPEGDEHPHAAAERTRHARQREQQQTTHEDVLAPVAVGEPPERHQQRGEGDGVRVQDPAEISCGGATGPVDAEARTDVVEGHVDHEQVEARHEGGADRHEDDESGPGLAWGRHSQDSRG